MKRVYSIFLICTLLLTASACSGATSAGQPEQTAAATPELTAETSATPAQTENPFPDTWVDFKTAEPVLDDSGDADAYDVKKVYVVNDEHYLFVALEVADEGHIDSTTMINGGNCVFIGIDMPGYFNVGNGETVYADTDGNGEYAGIAAYKYEDGLLIIRAPLKIFDGATSFTINSLFRGNNNGEKFDADMVDDFTYTLA